MVGAGWEKVSCGSFFTVAIKTAKTLWGTGDNSKGQIGLGATASVDSFTQIGSDSDWNSVDCGVHTTTVIKASEAIWVTGANYYGELGSGDYDGFRTTLYEVGETFSVTVGGWYHNLALKSDGILYVVGYSYRGQVGIGDQSIVEELTLCNKYTWLAVDTYKEHTIAIKQDQTVWGVGRNNTGQLAQGAGASQLLYSLTEIMSDFCSMVATGLQHSAVLNTANLELEMRRLSMILYKSLMEILTGHI